MPCDHLLQGEGRCLQLQLKCQRREDSGSRRHCNHPTFLTAPMGRRLGNPGLSISAVLDGALLPQRPGQAMRKPLTKVSICLPQLWRKLSRRPPHLRTGWLCRQARRQPEKRDLSALGERYPWALGSSYRATISTRVSQVESLPISPVSIDPW